MKITIFNGSPRRNGNTAAMTSSLIDKMRSKGAEVGEHFLYHMDVKGCMNCGACRTKDGLAPCAIKDDVPELLNEFLSSDIIVFASPVYMWHLTASLNAFIERLHSLCRHDPPAVNRMEGKRVAIAMTMGDDEYVAADIVTSLILFLDYFKMEYAGSFAIPFADKEQIMRSMYQEKMSDFVHRVMKT
jgi:multimeric flavodoxin WrbA